MSSFLEDNAAVSLEPMNASLGRTIEAARRRELTEGEVSEEEKKKRRVKVRRRMKSACAFLDLEKL